ncbi:hypothetical protein SD71_14035 [Cohnella kolymensis]|uniref:Carrier domain-containing protein n=1 Tax=Cohnella kolymensis TaxID=1590652 RepID=A0ABR5A2Z9_9BACL|nr:acyl carrier protein [Cohnella kolymensis]KIL35415.1 hypothetical protein SD71_14035 [Cohnella kolymensis]
MREHDFIAELTDLLEVEPSEFNDTYVLEENENWDSLAHVSVVAMIDEHFGLSLEYRDLRHCKTLGELLKLIEAKTASHAGVSTTP